MRPSNVNQAKSLPPIRLTIFSLILLAWLVSMMALMIADVWDETNALLIFSNWRNSLTFNEVIAHIWTESVANLYRPFPLSIAFIVDTMSPNREFSWHALRLLNIVTLIACFGLLLSIIRKRIQLTADKELLISSAYFGSSAVIISAGWFANIFDVFTLFFLLLGINSILKGNWVSAFLSFTVSFFCKEVSILIFPIIFMLCWTGNIPFQKGILLFIGSCASFLIYILIRQSILPIGSKEDIHGFEISLLPETTYAWFESFWLQNTRRSPEIINALITVAVLFSLKNAKVFLCTTGAMILSALIYLGMLPYSYDNQFSFMVFQSRLFLVPFTFVLIIIAIWGRRWSLYLILLPILLGGFKTYSEYSNFQNVYAEIYQKASEEESTLKIDYPDSPLTDYQRNLLIGDFPNERYFIDIKEGTLKER